MKLLNSVRRGNLLFQNRTIYSFYHNRSHGKVKDKEHFNLRCLLQEEPGDIVDQPLIHHEMCYLIPVIGLPLCKLHNATLESSSVTRPYDSEHSISFMERDDKRCCSRAGGAQRLCNGLPRNYSGFDSRWGRCKTELNVLRKGQLMGVPSLNDLNVDGTLNTTNQPTFARDNKWGPRL